MRAQKAYSTILPLLLKPFFTTKEAGALGVNSELLSHYAQIGKLERVQRGVYRAVDAPEPEFRWTDLIEAALAIPQGIVCLTSALAIYGLTEEMPRQHWIAVNHNTSAKAKRPIKIVRYRNTELGKSEVDLGGIRIPIFDRERTIIDSFRTLGRETAIKALKMALSPKASQKLDQVKLQKYAEQLRVQIEPYLMAVTT